MNQFSFFFLYYLLSWVLSLSLNMVVSIRHTLSPSFTSLPSLTPFLSLSLSLSHTHINTHTITLSHTHTHTHTHTQTHTDTQTRTPPSSPPPPPPTHTHTHRTWWMLIYCRCFSVMRWRYEKSDIKWITAWLLPRDGSTNLCGIYLSQGFIV